MAMTAQCQLQGPVLLFGGAYSNLAATRAMRLRAERLGIPPERVICTGDVVAYCAEPEQTASFIRDWGIPVVMGNCEQSLAAGSGDCGCGFEEGTACAALSLDWFAYASQRLGNGLRNWMRQLPRTIRFRLAGISVQVVHGTPSAINRFVYPSTPDRVKLQELAKSDCQILVGGHCGIPFGQQLGQRLWLNSGAIGLPANDGTPDGWYLLLQPRGNALAISWHRLSYDWREASRQMQRAGLPVAYRSALESGLWPSTEVLPAHERQRHGIPLAPPDMLLQQGDHG